MWPIQKTTRSAPPMAAVALALALVALAPFAHGGAQLSASQSAAQPPTSHDLRTSEAFSVPAPGQSLKLDGHTEVKGWALPRGWYFGKQRGEHSGIGFLWQAADRQLSLSTKGIRFVRRF